MIRIIAVCLSLFVTGVAYSDNPVPAPTKTAGQPKSDAKNNQKKPEQDKRVTKELPTVIELSPSSVIKVEATDKTEHHRDYSSSEWWMVYITSILAAITIALALYTARLWGATNTLAKGAEDTAKRRLRAYMLPEKAWLINIEDPRLTYSFQAKNYGQTPAHQVTVWVEWRYFDDIRKIEIPTERPEIPNLSKFLIGAQGFTLHSDCIYLNDERKKKIRDGEAMFFIFGDIRYKDIFGINRTTKFRFAWGGGYEITPGPIGALDVHAEGNETDDE